jgi:ribosomal protein S18 acetylase RimI-like enzyme
MEKTELNIVTATLSDLNQVRELEKLCFDKDAWPIIELVAVLILPGLVRLKVDLDGRMAGFIGGDPHRTEGTGWITTVGVRPEYRRLGIATVLIKACEEAMQVPAVKLSVRRSNFGAQHLYAGMGYHHVGVWEKYYEDGEDALIMEKNLLKTVDIP